LQSRAAARSTAHTPLGANFFRRELFVPVARHLGCWTQSVRPNRCHSALEKNGSLLPFCRAISDSDCSVIVPDVRRERDPSTIEEIRQITTIPRLKPRACLQASNPTVELWAPHDALLPASSAARESPVGDASLQASTGSPAAPEESPKDFKHADNAGGSGVGEFRTDFADLGIASQAGTRASGGNQTRALDDLASAR
jgi:hypothetical protein